MTGESASAKGQGMPVVHAPIAASAGEIAAILARDHCRAATRDLDEARAYMDGVIAPHRLTLGGRAGRMRFRHSALDLDPVQVHLIEYAAEGGRIGISAESIGPDLLLKIPLRGSARLSQGGPSCELRPGRVFLTRPGRPYAAEFSGDYCHLTVQIAAGLLARGEDGDPPDLDFDNAAINDSAAGPMLANAVLAACRMLTREGQPGEARAAVARAQGAMLLAMLAALPRGAGARNGATPYYIRRAEAHMRANLTEEIDLEDLVRISGVSRRSLHAGFRRFRDTTPMKRLKALRLEAVRDELLADIGPGTSVTAVATRYNFFQLSKFSRDFRQAFGQLPSQVARRHRRP